MSLLWATFTPCFRFLSTFSLSERKQQDPSHTVSLSPGGTQDMLAEFWSVLVRSSPVVSLTVPVSFSLDFKSGRILKFSKNSHLTSLCGDNS